MENDIQKSNFNQSTPNCINNENNAFAARDESTIPEILIVRRCSSSVRRPEIVVRRCSSTMSHNHNTTKADDGTLTCEPSSNYVQQDLLIRQSMIKSYNDNKDSSHNELILRPTEFLSHGGEIHQGQEKSSGRIHSVTLVDGNGATTLRKQLTTATEFGMDEKIQWKGGINKKNGIFQHLARFHNNNKFGGIRHVIMIALLVLYAVLGGLMFETIERENEINNVRTTSKILERSISRMANNITDLLCVEPTNGQIGKLQLLIRQYYLSMLKIEGRYIGSVFHKYETLAMKNMLNWHFGSSVFYAITLFTTIGYGTIACQTPSGKIASILYAMFGVPLMLVVLTDLGQLMQTFFASAYNWSRQVCRNFLRSIALKILDIDKVDVHHLGENCVSRRGYSSSSDGSNSADSCEAEEEAAAVHSTPLFLSMLIMVLYLSTVSFVITMFDWDENGATSINFGDAFYFSFISLSTIGLGDVMPNHMQYSPILAIFFLFGLALLSVVNSTVYTRIQGIFLALVDYLEEYFNQILYQRHTQEGHFVLKSLLPNIQILLVALPVFEANKEIHPFEAMMGFESAEQNNLKLPHISRHLIRAHSHHHHHTTAADPEKSFQPTLGILNTAPPSSRKNSTIVGHDFTRMGNIYKQQETRRRAMTTIGLIDDDSRTEEERGSLSADFRHLNNQQSHGKFNEKCRKDHHHTRHYMGKEIPKNERIRRVQSERGHGHYYCEEEGGGKRGQQRRIFASPKRIRRGFQVNNK